MNSDFAVIFRVASSREAGTWHWVGVDHHGIAVCSCGVPNWCRHIDATIMDAEIAMVPLEDRDAAIAARQLAAPKAVPPRLWKADWRRDRAWRGLPPLRAPATAAGLPIVAFRGRCSCGCTRETHRTDAEINGWTTVTKPGRSTTVVVSDDGGRDTDIAPVIDHDTWAVVRREWQATLLERIAMLTAEPDPTTTHRPGLPG